MAHCYKDGCEGEATHMLPAEHMTPALAAELGPSESITLFCDEHADEARASGIRGIRPIDQPATTDKAESPAVHPVPATPAAVFAEGKPPDAPTP